YQPLIQKEKDIFKELMSNATQISLPSFQLPKKLNKKDLLRQDIYIDTCGIEKMKVKAIYPSKEFEKFFNRSDPSSYKNTRPQFDYDFEYSTYLHKQNIKISKNHQLEIPVRSLDDSISVKVYNVLNIELFMSSEP
ncbi:33151_t:CDS:2, partial [Racocetra persica]